MNNRRAFARLVLLAASLYFAANDARPALGQTVIRGGAECKTCVIHLERVTTIGGLNSEIEENAMLARDRRGRLAFASEGRSIKVLIFSPEGQLIATIGKAGAGPGEFRNIYGIRFGPGDSLHVYDGELGRVSVYDPTLRLVHILPVPALITSPSGFWILPDGNYLMNANHRSRERSGFPFHVINRKGEIVRSFGGDGAFRGDFDYSWQRRVAVGDAGLWAINVNEYLLEFWDRTYSRETAIRRDATWFQPWWAYPDPESPSAPMAMAVNIDSAGRLWTVTLIPSREQRKYTRIVRGEAAVEYPVYTDQQRAFDAMIDVLDPSSGKIIASARSDRKLLWQLGNGYFGGYREEREGVGFIDVWRATLRVR